MTEFLTPDFKPFSVMHINHPYYLETCDMPSVPDVNDQVERREYMIWSMFDEFLTHDIKLFSVYIYIYILSLLIFICASDSFITI